MEEVIVSAIVGEVLSRSITFLIKTCSKSKRTEPPPPMPSEPEESLDRLARLLLRIGAIVEDAEGRQITNQAMLQQLNTLRHELQRGHFTLDALRCHAHDERHQSPADHDPAGRVSFTLSRFNPAKRICVCSSRGDEMDLRRVVASLEASVQGAAEFILLSGRYPPRLARQPYSMYLLVDNCMFGRQMEMERVIGFLLRGADDPGAEHLGVLPVVGCASVGKSTLVEHACIDERARNHFSKIVLLGGGDLVILDKDMEALADGAGVIKHENDSGESGGGRVLIIVDPDKDISDDFWRRFCSAVKNRFAHGSKIIVTSRSDKIVKFGTTLPLRLQFLTREAYWYFFKARAFGSVDVAMENPKLASIAMEMATEMNGCFMCTTIFGGMLRSRLDLGTWSMTLATYREFKQRNRIAFKQRDNFNCHPNLVDPWTLSSPILLPTVNKVSPGYFVVVNHYQTAPGIGDRAAPMVSVQDVIFGSARPQGKFAALAWRSHIPPYHNYVFSCEQRMPSVSTVSRKKIIPKVPM
ncbi:hypothetical protein HU200_039483 [Digitaria exilis]|uniref:NB-ARC domain-containing protein n=1 Tax=Digitaria exilis TaxID=1010633 RepID=A0A835EIB9_9POAL|nr:hypothetical protein HU200_039483 [Digitaria exilis]